MKRVLFFIETLNGGGAERVLTTLVQNIDRSKFNVTVCSVVDNGVYDEEIKKFANFKPIISKKLLNNPVGRLLYKIKYNLIYRYFPLAWVYRLWLPHGNDIEVAFVEGFATKLISHSTNRSSRKLAWVHCDLKRDHWTRLAFQNDEEEKNCYQRYDEIITVSQTQKESLHQLYGLLPVKVCYNPIDSDQILKLARQNEVVLPKLQFGVRLVATGRLTKVKGFDRLLRIVTRLKHESHPVELWILGDGGEKTLLEEIVKENHLQSVVTFWGFQTNPYQYMAQCDLFVCSSLSEGFSTAITEALILGLPVVSTEVSGVREQLEGGREKCGLITENSEEGLYQGLKTVLEQPELRKSLAVAARERGNDFQMKQLMSAIEKELLGA